MPKIRCAPASPYSAKVRMAAKYAGISFESVLTDTSKPSDEVRRQILIPLWNSYAFFVNYARLDGFDPSLWFLPYDLATGDVVGVCLCFDVEGTGSVENVGVRRAWRKRGIGLAMLNHALGEFWRRGIHNADLSVDAASPTGAPRLYARAGFEVARSYRRFEKRIVKRDA